MLNLWAYVRRHAMAPLEQWLSWQTEKEQDAGHAATQRRARVGLQHLSGMQRQANGAHSKAQAKRKPRPAEAEPHPR